MGRQGQAGRPASLSDQELVQEFLERARFVADCGAARRLDLSTIGTKMQVAVTPAHGAEVSWESPGDGVIEQAATRIRPLMLQSESVYAPKVLNVISKYLPEGPRREQASALRHRWLGFADNAYFSYGTTHEIGIRPDAGKLRSDRQIAEDYIYGHLVHHDVERRARIKYVGDSTRMQAVALWMKDAILLTEYTRRFVIDVLDEGLF